MSFITNMNTDKPVGTDYVSTLDDAVRQTRKWTDAFMRTISGYPNVETVQVLGWDNSSRPTAHSNNGMYLLGYNKDTHQLELVDNDGEQVTEFSKTLALIAHPVGSFFETTNTSFNPNTAWGGTWEKMTDGRFLVSSNNKMSVGSTGGAETVTLGIPEIPTHYHPHKHYHTHTRGSMNITGTISASTEKYVGNITGAFYAIPQYATVGSHEYKVFGVGFDASRAWTGETSDSISTYKTNSSNYPCAMVDFNSSNKMRVGGGKAHNNMPPYLVVVRWHRTA